MIQPFRFNNMLKDVELYYEHEYNSTQKEKLYEIFKYTEDRVMERAVSFLMETFKSFPRQPLPLGPDFGDALKEASKERSEATPEELDDGQCSKCHGIGGTVEKYLHLGIEYDGFFPCPHCRKGRIYQKSFGLVKAKKSFLRKDGGA